MAELYEFCMQDFREGRKKALDEVFEMYYSPMYVFAVKIVNDEDVAKDLAIDALTSLFKLRKNFTQLANIRAFLYVTTRNSSLNYLKFKKRLVKKEEGFIRVMQNTQEIVLDQIDGALLKKVYDASLHALPSQTRKVIELIFEEELTYPEIAQQLSISVHTVKGLRKYGLRKIECSITAQGLSRALVKLINCLIPATLLYLT
jgi:RNA polymerase sigma factor (sigma-70 family)